MVLLESWNHSFTEFHLWTRTLSSFRFLWFSSSCMWVASVWPPSEIWIHRSRCEVQKRSGLACALLFLHFTQWSSDRSCARPALQGLLSQLTYYYTVLQTRFLVFYPACLQNSSEIPDSCELDVVEQWPLTSGASASCQCTACGIITLWLFGYFVNWSILHWYCDSSEYF